MKNFYNNTIRSSFEMMLKESYVDNKEEEKFVAYSELLVTIPNKRTDLLVKEVLEGYIKEYGLKVFNNNLRKIISNGVLGVNKEKELSIEENELYSNICDYYDNLINELEVI